MNTMNCLSSLKNLTKYHQEKILHLHLRIILNVTQSKIHWARDRKQHNQTNSSRKWNPSKEYHGQKKRKSYQKTNVEAATIFIKNDWAITMTLIDYELDLWACSRKLLIKMMHSQNHHRKATRKDMWHGLLSANRKTYINKPFCKARSKIK